MKKRPSSAARPNKPTTPRSGECDGSPPYPPTPPSTGEIPGEEKLEFVNYGTNDLAKGFNDGQLVQHTMRMESGELSYVFSLRGGPHKRRTLDKIALTVLFGRCTVVIQNLGTTELNPGQTLDLPAGSTFSFTTDEKSVLLGRSLAGPGLGKGWNDRDP